MKNFPGGTAPHTVQIGLWRFGQLMVITTANKNETYSLKKIELHFKAKLILQIALKVVHL